MYCNKCLHCVLFIFYVNVSFSQGNCLFYPEDSGERLACELSYRAISYKQGSRTSQVLFDAAIKLGPEYAYAYYEKSVPFFKRGLFNEGIQLLNKAVALEPENYLCYRAYWFFSQRSYEQCANDLELYYNTLGMPTGSTPGGDKEMRMLLGMSYARLHKLSEAIELVSSAINNYEEMNYFIGPYDYHVMGLLYFENNEFNKAKKAFYSQIEMNPNFADSYYYMALIAKSETNFQLASDFLRTSLDKFEGANGGFSFNGFIDWNVYRELVEKEFMTFDVGIDLD